MERNTMIGILLAAGYATRLYPLTIDKPKALLPVKGRPMLDYIADELDTLPDLSKICLISNHRFVSHFEKWAEDRQSVSRTPIEVIDDMTTSDDDKLGAVGDIQFAIENLPIDDDVVILAGDNLFTYRLLDVYQHFRKIDRDMLLGIPIKEKELLQRLAVAVLDKDGKVLDMEEKPAEPKSQTAIFATYFYKKETLPLIRQYLDEGNSPDAPGNFPAWLYKKKDVFVYLADGTCIDIGTPESYAEANKDFPSEN